MRRWLPGRASSLSRDGAPGLAGRQAGRQAGSQPGRQAGRQAAGPPPARLGREAKISAHATVRTNDRAACLETARPASQAGRQAASQPARQPAGPPLRSRRGDSAPARPLRAATPSRTASRAAHSFTHGVALSVVFLQVPGRKMIAEGPFASLQRAPACTSRRQPCVNRAPRPSSRDRAQRRVSKQRRCGLCK